MMRVRRPSKKRQAPHGSYQISDSLICECKHPYSQHMNAHALFADGGRCHVSGCLCAQFRRAFYHAAAYEQPRYVK